jgi:subtilisin-like proprotein convertase family protein
VTRARRLAAAALGVLVASVAWVPVPPAAAESQTFFNTAPITFSGTAAGPAGTYPSTITVSGLEGPITDVDVNINAIDMDHLQGLHLRLESPSGESEILKQFYCESDEAEGTILTFDQQAPAKLPVDGGCVDGSYQPSSYCVGGCLPFEDVVDRSANLDNFKNENANGSWKLYAFRTCYYGCPATGDAISAGWSLNIDTGPYDLDTSSTGTSGPGAPYPATRLVANDLDLLITDLDVRVEGIFHTYPDDLEIVLEKVGGPKVKLMSDACGGGDVNAYGWTWNDEAVSTMPDEGSAPTTCASPGYRPTDHAPGDSLPAPAPAGPYETSLSAFDLLDPRGEWRMWVADDATGDEGFFTGRFTLTYATRMRAGVSWSDPTQDVTEGSSHTVYVNRPGTALAAGTVRVTSTPGTAGAGDFVPIDTVLQFEPGQRSATVQVETLPDAVDEADEQFSLILSGSTGDTRVVSPSALTVTIPAQTPPDRAAPDTTVTKAPKARTTKRKARIAFTADEAGVRFECKLDAKAWKPCTSPFTTKKLGYGKHKVRIRAVDGAGNVESRPAVVRWRIVRG